MTIDPTSVKACFLRIFSDVARCLPLQTEIRTSEWTLDNHNESVVVSKQPDFRPQFRDLSGMRDGGTSGATASTTKPESSAPAAFTKHDPINMTQKVSPVACVGPESSVLETLVIKPEGAGDHQADGSPSGSYTMAQVRSSQKSDDIVSYEEKIKRDTGKYWNELQRMVQ